MQQLSQSRSEATGRVQRAEILLRYHGGETVSRIAVALRTNRPRVERCIAKALTLDACGALQDLTGRGRHPVLSAEARAWVVALACQKPKYLGYTQELWTTRLLAKRVRKHCAAAGHPSLQRLVREMASKILRAQAVQPHKIEYYPERRDAEFEAKMKQVLYVDNHSAHISRETRAFLATVPNRFEFVFTPTHGSWLKLIESFFGKMAKTLLRGIHVKSKEELKTRIELYLREVSEEPVVFRWKYKLETLSVAETH